MCVPGLLTLELLVDQPLILCLTRVVPLPFCQRIRISSQVVCIVNSLVFRIDITVIISFFIVRIRVAMYEKHDMHSCVT